MFSALRLNQLGSSPHARGARNSRLVGGWVDGIIPACAGSTCVIESRTSRRRDHPRMRGEHSFAHFRKSSMPGSSPHARGALAVAVPDRVLDGIIPACAGSTISGMLSDTYTGDHPRMRGEHAFVIAPKISSEGSSPHARGAHGQRRVEVQGRGIIPACAGSTAPGIASASWFQGSSPHARGARFARRRYRSKSGIIPACAGSTLKNPSSRYHTV